MAVIVAVTFTVCAAPATPGPLPTTAAPVCASAGVDATAAASASVARIECVFMRKLLGVVSRGAVTGARGKSMRYGGRRS